MNNTPDDRVVGSIEWRVMEAKSMMRGFTKAGYEQLLHPSKIILASYGSGKSAAYLRVIEWIAWILVKCNSADVDAPDSIISTLHKLSLDIPHHSRVECAIYLRAFELRQRTRERTALVAGWGWDHGSKSEKIKVSLVKKDRFMNVCPTALAIFYEADDIALICVRVELGKWLNPSMVNHLLNASLQIKSESEAKSAEGICEFGSAMPLSARDTEEANYARTQERVARRKNEQIEREKNEEAQAARKRNSTSKK